MSTEKKFLCIYQPRKNTNQLREFTQNLHAVISREKKSLSIYKPRIFFEYNFIDPGINTSKLREFKLNKYMCKVKIKVVFEHI